MEASDEPIIFRQSLVQAILVQLVCVTLTIGFYSYPNGWPIALFLLSIFLILGRHFILARKHLRMELFKDHLIAYNARNEQILTAKYEEITGRHPWDGENGDWLRTIQGNFEVGRLERKTELWKLLSERTGLRLHPGDNTPVIGRKTP